jgi:hypothetical protein
MAQGVGVGVSVGGTGVEVAVTVGVGTGVEVAVAVGVGVEAAVAVGIGVGVDVNVRLGVAVGNGDGVNVAVDVGDGDGLNVGVGGPFGVTNGCNRYKETANSNKNPPIIPEPFCLSGGISIMNLPPTPPASARIRKTMPPMPRIVGNGLVAIAFKNSSKDSILSFLSGRLNRN